MKKILFISLFVALVVPNFVFAVWWNPLTWFDKKSIESEVVAPVIPASTPQVSELVVPPIPETVVVEKTVEVPVEKVVTQTITVQDPLLQAQIDSLVAEKTSLQAEVAKLLAANNSLNSELIACENEPVDTTDQALNDMENILEDILDLTDSWFSTTGVGSQRNLVVSDCTSGLSKLSNLVYEYNTKVVFNEVGSAAPSLNECTQTAVEDYESKINILLSNF